VRFSGETFRRLGLMLALAGFCLLSPETLAHGPNLCLWRRLFRLASCPACGSTRALAAFYHGRFAEALAFNRNVVVTGPLLLVLAVRDFARLFHKMGE
jgi:uncharacterized protein DUF2752